MKYCSHCGSSQIHFKVPHGDTRARYICQGCDTIHYSNPNVVVGCLIVKDEKVMLCKRGIPPRAGLWNLPSGFLENGETLEEGAAREVLEETEASVKVEILLSIYDVLNAGQVNIHFLASMEGDHYATTEESLEIKWFHFDEIPFSEMAFSSHTFTIKSYLESSDTPPHIGNNKKIKGW